MASCKRVTGSPNIHFYQEAAAGAADAFRIGDLVQLDSSGELIIASAGKILGIAHKTATGTASTEIPVDVLSQHDEFIATWTAEATSEAHIGSICDFTFTVGAHTLASGGTTDVVMVDFASGSPVGTTSGKVIVRVIPAASQLAGVTQ